MSRAEYKILEVRSAAAGPLRLKYLNGPWIEVDVRGWIDDGPLFEPLAEDAFVARASLVNGGRSVEWPNGLDIGADSLWEEGREVAAATRRTA